MTKQRLTDQLIYYWARSRPAVAVTLLIMTVVVPRFGLPDLQWPLLIASLLIITNVIFDIYKLIASDTEIRTFQNFHAASHDLLSRLKQTANATGKVEIKWLGMGMEYGAPLLEDIIEKNSERHKLVIKICMLDPEWDALKSINDSWTGATSVLRIQRAYSRLLRQESGGQNHLELSLYRHMPTWHGFLLNERYLYLSECTWSGSKKSKRLLGGENEYELFDIYGSERDRKMIAKFAGWFEFSSQSPYDLSAMADAVDKPADRAKAN